MIKQLADVEIGEDADITLKAAFTELIRETTE